MVVTPVCLLSGVCCVCMLQSATFKVNIRFSNVASELLIWVSQAVGVVCLVVYVYVCVCIDD